MPAPGESWWHEALQFVVITGSILLASLALAVLVAVAVDRNWLLIRWMDRAMDACTNWLNKKLDDRDRH